MKTFLKLVVVLAILATVFYLFVYKTPQRRAFDQALAAAQQGNSEAQLKVGQMYLAGQAVPADVQAAQEWYVKAAAQGNATAAYELAQMYLSGEKITRDVEAGLAYLKMAAEKGNASAQYMLGRLYQTGAENLEPHAAQGAFWLMKAAAQGDADAQNALRDVQTNQPQVYEQATQAQQILTQADAGDVQAQLAAGQLFLDGNIVAKNTDMAARYLEKAAQAGIPQALYEMSVFYAADEGPLPKDEAKAADYLNKAAEAGYAPAQYALGNQIYQAAQTPEDYAKALAWFDKAGKQNNTEALYMSGIMYMQGQGTPVTVPLAIAAFKQAAELGHANAQYVVGQSYWRGIGLPKSKEKAVQWLELAKQNGNPQAEALLAEING